MTTLSHLVSAGLLCTALSACGVQTTFSSAPATDPAGTTAATGTETESLNAELQTVRDATAVYLDEARARADGYVPMTSTCVSSADGTVGIPYVNSARMDGTADLAHPAGLLYLPVGDGYRLMAVRYMVPVMQGGAAYTGASAPTVDPAVHPALFGHEMDGPVAGDVPGQPWHFELYAWVWQNNPAGPLAHWNASVTCQ